MNIKTLVSSAGTSAPITRDTVSFLGMELSMVDAEAGLNTTFALLIVTLLGAVCLSFFFFKSRKQVKKGLEVASFDMKTKL